MSRAVLLEFSIVKYLWYTIYTDVQQIILSLYYTYTHIYNIRYSNVSLSLYFHDVRGRKHSDGTVQLS